MKEDIGKNTKELILKELQTILTVFYILIVGIGMLFTYKKYAEFGINIFDYADIFDFLIAPFSDSKILLFSAITLLLVYLLFKLDRVFQKRFPKTYSKVNFGMDKKSWYNFYRYTALALLLIIYLNLFADFYGKFSKKQIEKKSRISLKYSDNQNIHGIVIGKTKEILFLLQGKKVKAIPINSVVKEYEIE